MSKLITIFKDKAILKRVLLTLGFLLLFRFGTLLTVPGANLNAAQSIETGSFLDMMNLLGGGGLASFSILSLGVTPYITASIIIQLLSSDVIPPLTRLKKQGERGRIKVEKITRALAMLLAVIQAFAVTMALTSSGLIKPDQIGGSAITTTLLYVLILLTGSMISIWVADQITMKGIGNGTSLLIFAGIVAALPQQILQAFGIFSSNSGTSVDIFSGIALFVVYMLFFMMIILLISFIESSERRLPIQQTGQGLQLEKQKQTYLPIKVNPAGVIPVIFASALMTIPQTIIQFLPETSATHMAKELLSLSSPVGFTLYGLMVFAFSVFYSHININSEETADNFKKGGTFIVGVKPGPETERYISRTVSSLSIIGGAILTIIAILPYLVTSIGIPQSVALGGTGTIIMVSTARDTWEQIQARVIASDTKIKQKKKLKTFGQIKELKEENKDTVLFD